MASITTPMALTRPQQQGFLQYFQHITESFKTCWDFRTSLEIRDRAYQREVSFSGVHQDAKNANRYAGNVTKLQELIVPVVMPQIESNVAYLAGVFCTDFPMFRVVGAPDKMPQAAQMNAIIAENSLKNAWVRELIMFFRDGLKYNFHALEVSWERKKIYSVGTDRTAGGNIAKTSEIYCEGNKLERWDLYNTFFDYRVAPARVHTEGEFAGCHKLMNRIQLKQLMLELQGSNAAMNYREALESASGDITVGDKNSLYYVPQINMDLLSLQRFSSGLDWMAWMNNDLRRSELNYRGSYIVSKVHCRIIPDDFGLRGSHASHPQIWTLYVVNGQHIIHAERQTNAHNWLPVIFGQPNEDGLGFQTKSALDNALPFQEMSSALWNSALAAKRRLVYDRIIYNPSLIRKEDIDRVSEVSRIPMRNANYNRSPSEAVYQIPFRDDNANSTIAMAQQITEMADVSTGQNRVQRGQFQKGNKLSGEFDAVMANSNLRQQTQALSIEYQVFQPLKDILKLNMLQYQPDGRTIYDRENKAATKIDMTTLREADLAFTISDGMLTVDKLMSPQLMQVFLQSAQAMPAVQSEYDVLGLFLYWMKLQGATWIDDFYRTPEQQQQMLAKMQAATAATNPQPPQQPPQGASNAAPSQQ